MDLPRLFAIMLWLVPAAKQPEGADAAGARYGVIANAVEEVAGADDRLCRFLLAVARHESTFRAAVHSGARKGDGGRSWGLFQKMVGRHASMKILGTPYRAGDIVGIDDAPTKRAVEVAAHDLAPIIERCGGRAMCVFKSYGGIPAGKELPPIVKERLDARVATYQSLLSK